MSFQARLPLQIEHTCNLRLVPESDVACGDAQVFCRLCTNCHPPFGSVLVDLFNRLQVPFPSMLIMVNLVFDACDLL